MDEEYLDQASTDIIVGACQTLTYATTLSQDGTVKLTGTTVGGDEFLVLATRDPGLLALVSPLVEKWYADRETYSKMVTIAENSPSGTEVL